MSSKNDWEDFWLDDNSRDLLNGIDNPKRWEDVCWKVTLEQWIEVFGELAPGLRILECGCGSATVSRYMVQNGYEATLIDYAKSSIELAKTRFSRKGLKASFVLGDINKLPFEDDSFDVVFSGGVLEYFENYEIPISEMIRVLRPGGVFAANMVPRKFSIQTIADWQRTLAHTIKALSKRNFNDVFKSVKLVPKHYNINTATLDDYKNTASYYGLSNIETRCVTPFPLLSLPPSLQKKYVQYICRHLDLWKNFNSSDKAWKRYVGMTYMIFGTK